MKEYKVSGHTKRLRGDLNYNFTKTYLVKAYSTKDARRIAAKQLRGYAKLMGWEYSYCQAPMIKKTVENGWVWSKA